MKPHFRAAGDSTAAISCATIVPPWLAVLTRNTPGQRVSLCCTSPHGDRVGGLNTPVARCSFSCTAATFSKMPRSSGEK